MSWKPIVVGVDASFEAAEAVAFATRTAQRTGTGVQLVHAIRDALASSQVPDSRYRSALIEQSRAQLVAVLRASLPQEVLAILSVRLGPTAAVLKQVAADVAAELVVLGGKHHSALGRWLGGSTSLNVARTTDVPLLVTAGRATAVHRVLVAVDLSGAAAPTLAAAQRYAELFGAELRAVSVLEPLPVMPEITPPYDVTEYDAMSEELVQRELWPLISSRSVEKVVRHGTAVATISQEVADWRADLLVVGSHGKGWAQRLLLGSVTEQLLNHLPTSLLVVPAATAAVEPVPANAEWPEPTALRAEASSLTAPAALCRACRG
ncbi:MAG TPA: universal stress protein [Gemmatimonadales bacterium]|nr:universal stress protein [Gemmatimonadales bacterium]